MDLLWQFHTDSNRDYDGHERAKIVMCSAATAQFYCVKYGIDYHLATESRFFAGGVHGGPAMDRFQLLDERYDSYENILYADTDVLFSSEAPDIFKLYAGSIIAGLNVNHSRDEEVLRNGWLNGVVDPERYRKTYAHGCTILFSREIRQWLRRNVDPLCIEEDRGKYWQKHGLEMKWPVYDQSLLAYWLTNSPYSLTPIDRRFMDGPYFFHEGGKKSDEVIKRIFARYKTIHDDWLGSNDRA